MLGQLPLNALPLCMELSVGDLYKTHEEHDDFIFAYLDKEATPEDPVVTATDKLLAKAGQAKPLLCGLVREKRGELQQTGTDNEKQRQQRIQCLALYLLLDNFPECWNRIHLAAFELLKSVLTIIRALQGKVIFPPKWSAVIFSLENALGSSEVHGVQFGIDPLPGSHAAKFATGYAFIFNAPDQNSSSFNHLPSSKGLRKYGLPNDVSLTDVKSFEKNFIVKHGIALVNFIRMIPAGSWAGSNNIFRSAWADFNLAWLGLIGVTRDTASSRVVISENPTYPFEGYSGVTQDLLTRAPRCTHPSYHNRRHIHIPIIREEYNRFMKEVAATAAAAVLAKATAEAAAKEAVAEAALAEAALAEAALAEAALAEEALAEEALAEAALAEEAEDQAEEREAEEEGEGTLVDSMANLGI